MKIDDIFTTFIEETCRLTHKTVALTQ